MSQSLLDPYYFNKNERRGIIVFLMAILSLFGFQIMLPSFYNPYKKVLEELEQQSVQNKPIPVVDQLIAEKDTSGEGMQVPVVSSSIPLNSERKQAEPRKQQAYFQFDPNTISMDSIMLLGISPFVAKNWQKYREAGGKFKDKAQLLKIYGMDTIKYKAISSYINLAEKQPKNNFLDVSGIKIDLNKADATELQKLKGIGPVYSQRIIKFRDALGGFSNMDQLAEVYGFPDSSYQAIKPFLSISALDRKMNINTVDLEQLAAHPYVRWKKAKLIIRFRTQRQGIEALDQLYQIKAFDSSFVKKIIPYFEIKSHE